MLSTLRVLRNRAIVCSDYIAKASTAGIHICVKRIEPNKNPTFKRSNASLSAIPINSISFMSTGPPPKPDQGTSMSESIPQEPIPEPPSIPPPVAESINLHTIGKANGNGRVQPSIEDTIPPPPEAPFSEANGEPTLESLGLGGWSPVGLVQHCLEFLHINLELPWWGTIVIGTIVVRTLLFPLVIVAQRNAANMHNNLPAMQEIQLKMSEARQRGDRLDAARYAQEMMEFMKQKNLNPLKNMLVPLAQAPLFISFFMALRGMANLPVDSLREGGLFWFVDLTLPDQFYLLPIITSLTLLVTIEVGTDTVRLNSANMGMMKYVLRGIPIVIFPFTVGFQSAILVYWTSTNFISLLQVSFLKIPQVRTFFKIDPLAKHDQKKMPIKDKGLIKGVKDSWTNMKITRELEERQRIDEINFMQAGRGAVKKTYKYDPTQRRPPRSIGAIEVKKRD